MEEMDEGAGHDAQGARRTPQSPRDFDPHLPLQRAAHVSLELEASGRIQVRHADGTYSVIPRGMEILHRFGSPVSAAEVLEALEFQGAREWINVYEAIRRLHGAGVLHEPGQPAAPASARGYEGAPQHAVMLNDRGRTAGFIRAIDAVVRPGDVVVDIGTGTGILALAAARAGARGVFAIEPSSMAETAAEVFASNGFADRITILRGTSFSVSLPELADVVVSEMLGHHALDEGLLAIFADARVRHARPGARVIPRHVSVLARPVAIPDEILARHSPSPRALSAWKEWYGFDMSAVARRPGRSSFLIRPDDAMSWPAIAPAVPVFEINLETDRIPEIVNVSTTAMAERAGTVNGLVLGMRAQLGPNEVIETLPGLAASDNHWKCAVWLPPAPFDVHPGDPLHVRFSHGESQNGRGEFAEVMAADGSELRREDGQRDEPVPSPSVISAASVIVQSPDHLAARFGDEVAVAGSGVVPFLLDSTAAAIWSLLASPVRLDAVCVALAAEFDVEPEACQSDVIAFVEDLRAKGLVTVAV